MKDKKVNNMNNKARQAVIRNSFNKTMLLSIPLFTLAITLITSAVLSPNLAQATPSTSSDLTIKVAEAISLSLNECGSDLPSESVNLRITPTSSGTFGSVCQKVTVDTNNPGYTLLVKASSTNTNYDSGNPTNALLYQNPTTATIFPTIPAMSDTATITTPTTITNETWGFGVENLSNSGFDTTYEVNNANNKFAEMPIDDTEVYFTDTWPLPQNTFDFYYGAKLSTATTAGTYKTMVTYTAVGEEAPMPLTFKQISAGYDHTCVIASNDWAYCWGYGSSGQLGNNSTDNQPTPVAISQGDIPTGLTIKQITASQSHTCAIASNDQAYCWGLGDNGRLGNGSTSGNQSIPVAVSQGVIPIDSTIKQIVTGQYHTCAIASDDQAYCWGLSDYGQLGNGTTGSGQSTPVAVRQGTIPTDSTIKQITASGWHTCVIASNDQAYCWGNGGNGRLGNGSTSNQTSPGAVSRGVIPADLTIKQVSAGRYHTCAIASNDQAYCWGNVSNGRLGNGLTSGTQYVPAAVKQGDIPTDLTVQQITTGGTHTCAIASNDQAYCWGGGTSGQLGNVLTSGDQSTPVAVNQGDIPTDLTIKQIVTGLSHTCAIASNNQAYCWGSGASGQLGNGLVNSSDVPVKVANPTL